MSLSHRCTGTAWAAALWAFGFAALSFYWALGGTFLADTQSGQILALSDNRWFLALVWLTGLLKGAAGLVALSLIQPWGNTFPRGLRLFGAWSIGALLTLYSAANLGVRALMALGVIPTPASMMTARATWHLLLWDPFFVLGGVLFLLCFRAAMRERAAAMIS